MCDFGLVSLGVGAASALASGLAGMQAGSANAALAKREGLLARRQANADAASLAARGAYQLGGMRRDAAGSGNLSALDLIADSASNLSLDVQRVKYGGRAAQADANAQASLYRWQGRGALLGGIVGAGTSLLQGFGSGSPSTTLQDKYPVIGTAKSFMPSLAAKY